MLPSLSSLPSVRRKNDNSSNLLFRKRKDDTNDGLKDAAARRNIVPHVMPILLLIVVGIIVSENVMLGNWVYNPNRASSRTIAATTIAATTTTTSSSSSSSPRKKSKRRKRRTNVLVHIVRPMRMSTQTCEPMPPDLYGNELVSSSSSSLLSPSAALSSASQSLPAYFVKAADYYHPDSYVYANYTELYQAAENVTDPKTYLAAPCLLNPLPFFRHFPHTMQQLYQCFDYWAMASRGSYLEVEDGSQDTENNRKARASNITWLLLYDDRIGSMNKTANQGFFEGKTNPFVRGLLGDLLQPYLGLTVMSLMDYYNHSDYYHPNQTIQSYSPSNFDGYLHRHPDQWHPLALLLTNSVSTSRTWQDVVSKVMNHVQHVISGFNGCTKTPAVMTTPTTSSANLTTNTTTRPAPQGREPDHLPQIMRPPSIAILNRKKVRELINAKELADRLSSLKIIISVSSSPNDDADVDNDGDNGNNNDQRNNDESSSGHDDRFDFDVFTENGDGSYKGSSSCIINGDGTSSTNIVMDVERVPVVFFEHSSFVDQVSFFRTHDIIITGHGAQLTGLVFMGHQPCRQLMEVFPYNYGFPNYFGSLAVQAGIHHSYLYLDRSHVQQGDPNGTIPTDAWSAAAGDVDVDVVMPWETRFSDDLEERRVDRKAQLCPSTDAVVDAVAELVKDWYQCHHGQRS